MKRVLVLVDGFNLFHAIRDLDPSLMEIDISALASRLTNRKSETIYKIQYFASLITHLNQKTIQDQENYLQKLRGSNVEVILGRFRPRTTVCPICGAREVKHVEKETDVNIAVAMVSHCYEQKISKILLFSADSDMKGAILKVKARFPNIEIRLVSTSKYLQPVHRSLGRITDGQIRLSTKMLSGLTFK